MKKCKYLIYPLLATMGLTSCLKEEYMAPNDLVDVSWHIGADQSNRDPIMISLNEFTSFMDLSQGALSHMWEVSKDGTYFLEGNIGNGVQDFEQYVADIPHTNDKSRITVWFTKSGHHTVRLRNTFASEVSYTYRPEPDKRPEYKVTKHAEYVNGVYVMDTTFVVDVYDNVLVPGVRIFKDEAMTEEVLLSDDTLSVASINLEYGDILYFQDASTDRPNFWSWKCLDASIPEIQGEVVAMKFTKLTDEQPFKVTQLIERINDPDNNSLPIAPAKAREIPLNIFVGPSSAPIEMQEVSYLGQNRLKIVLGNAGFDPANLSDVTENFTLDIVNNYDGRPEYTASIKASKLTIDPENENILIVEFAEPIYNTDQMTFSYTPSNNPLLTTDGREFEGFTREVKVEIRNFLEEDIFNFNQGGPLHETWIGLNKLVIDDKLILLSKVPDPTNPSETVLRVDCLINGTRVKNINKFDAPAGKYTFNMKLYIEPGSTTSSGFNMFVTNEDKFNDVTFTSGAPLKWIQQATPEYIGQWGEIVSVFNSPGGEDRNFAINNNEFIGTYYVKNISLTNLEVRP